MESVRPTPTRVWLIIAFLVLALHTVLPLVLAPLWNARPSTTPRFEVAPLPADQLERMRDRWRREQAILDPADRPASPEAPKDARYASDRNLKVDREQRARPGDEGSRPGARTAPAAPQTRAAPQMPDQTQRPSLQNLGVPLKLDPVPPAPAPAAPAPQGLAGNPRIRGGGAQQQILDDALPEGDVNLLNASESKYYSFHARMREAVLPVWRSRVQSLVPAYGGELSGKLPSGDYITHLEVRLNREGEVIGLEVSRSSGIPEFDRAAELPFRKLERFPNPPAGLLDENGEVRFTYRYLVRIASGFGGR